MGGSAGAFGDAGARCWVVADAGGFAGAGARSGSDDGSPQPPSSATVSANPAIHALRMRQLPPR
ncbi:hypothetical protein Stsp02_46310 [Streptomyces sp. NBRC 14336]|nr:hypothetical protein Stsp02_46310 [Streptomyces sp. NBRC 14336]